MDEALEATRRRIRGDEPVLVIEAPAGYGKTHEAVEAAKAIAPALPVGQQVLFLTHTNGARETFNRRLRGGAVVMRTIHALAADLVTMYAAPLGLPRPLQPDRGQPPFAEMVELAIRVITGRPEVARGLAVRYPVILVDEYQDCDAAQHRFISQIAASGPSRLRLFGDHLQAIYDWGDDPVDFAELARGNPTVRLETPRRWSDPVMRDFVVEARRALLAEEAIDLRRWRSCVSVRMWRGEVPAKGHEGHAPECLRALKGCLGRDVVILTHHNAHALGLSKRLPGGGRYHEGADHEPARILLEKVVEASGDPRALSLLLVRVMKSWGQGMTKQYRAQIEEICTPDGVVVGSKKKIRRFAHICEDLYAEPTIACWLSCLRRVLRGEHGIDGWRVLRGDQIYLLANLRPGSEDDPTALLHAESQARSTCRRAPARGFMVIHKAKGLEFDEVAIPYCSGTYFENDWKSRRRMYVAISRAQRHVHFLIPEGDRTPLLRA
jgi:hypothetical protein